MINESRLSNVLLATLMGIVILLMAALASLFIKMNQLQSEVLTTLTALQTGAMEQKMGLEVGSQAPAFSLPDAAGQVASLDDWKEQKVLLAFSSVQCPGCIQMFPHLKRFSERAGDVQIVMISKGSGEENRQLVSAQEFNFPVLTWEDAVAQEYQVPGTPFFYVIDQKGVIRNAGFANSEEKLETLVKGGAE